MAQKTLILTVFVLFLFTMALVFQVSSTYATTFNNDFETGDLTDWEQGEDPGFEFQPTFGDNPTARNRGQPSNHQGDWWIGMYEKYQGPDVQGQVLGGTQGDGPIGTLTSIEFSIIGDTMNFLIGGGTHPWDTDPNPCAVNLVVNDEVVRTATGANTETMARQEWDISDLQGSKARIVIVDQNSAGWGHPNFDDVNQADANGNNIAWDRVLVVDTQGKLPVAWGRIKKYY